MNLQSLGARWRLAVDVALGPAVVIPAVLTLAVYAASVTSHQPLVRILLTAVFGIAASVVGSQAHQHWAKRSQSGLLNYKGNSAVRSLVSLRASIEDIVAALGAFMAEVEQAKLDRDVILANLRSLVHMCTAAERLVDNGVDEWRDIVPDIDKIVKIHNELLRLTAEGADLRDRIEALSADQEQTVEEKASVERKLRVSLTGKDAEIAKLRTELSEAKARVYTPTFLGTEYQSAPSILTTLAATQKAGASPYPWITPGKLCVSCGLPLTEDATVPSEADGRCTTCRLLNKPFGTVATVAPK